MTPLGGQTTTRRRHIQRQLQLALGCCVRAAATAIDDSRTTRSSPFPQLRTAEGSPCPDYDPSNIDEWDSCAGPVRY